MTFDESEDMSFQLSLIESLVKGFVSKGDSDKSINNLRGDLDKSMQGSMKTWDLDNLQIQIKERMGHMEENIGRIVKLPQLQDENIPKEDEVGQGTHEDKIVLMPSYHP